MRRRWLVIGLADLGKQRFDFLRACTRYGLQRLGTREQAFGPGAVRAHDFMPIEQDVEILDRLDILGDIDPVQIDQLDRGQQNFGTVKHPLRDGRADEDAVLARHQKILRGQALAQGTGT